MALPLLPLSQPARAMADAGSWPNFRTRGDFSYLAVDRVATSGGVYTVTANPGQARVIDIPRGESYALEVTDILPPASNHNFDTEVSPRSGNFDFSEPRVFTVRDRGTGRFAPVVMIGQEALTREDLQDESGNPDEAKIAPYKAAIFANVGAATEALAVIAEKQKTIGLAVAAARGGTLRVGDYHPAYYNMLQEIAHSVVDIAGGNSASGYLEYTFDQSADWRGENDGQILIDQIEVKFQRYINDLVVADLNIRPDAAAKLIPYMAEFYTDFAEEHRISEPAFSSFKIGGYEGEIDAESATVTLAIPEGTDLSALPAPSFSLNGWTKADFMAGTLEDGTLAYKLYPYEATTGVTYDGVNQSMEDGNGFGIDLSRQWTVRARAGEPQARLRSFAFTVGGETYGGVIDETARTVAVTLPDKTPLTALSPVIECGGGATSDMDAGAFDFSRPRTLTVTNGGASAVYLVTVTRSDMAGESRIKAFRYYSQYAEIDEAAGAIMLTVPESVGKTFAPTIELMSPTARVSPASGVTQDFTEPVTYTVTAQNGAKSAYSVTVRTAGETAESPYISRMSALRDTILAAYPRDAGEDWEWMNLGLKERRLRHSAADLPAKLDLAKELGEVNRKKQTDYARLLMTLTALGIDATRLEDFGGPFSIGTVMTNDLVKELYSFQGSYTINGPIFSLIALDMGGYAVPDDAVWTRARLLDTILEHEYGTDGFGIDMVAMLMQSVAPYRNDPVYGARVREKLDLGVRLITGEERAKGIWPMTEHYHFGAALFGSETSESASQVICALSAAGIDVLEDPRFTADGGAKGVIPSWMSFAVPGGFEHIAGGGLNGMATYQACYTLQWYLNFKSGGGAGHPYSLYHRVFNFSGVSEADRSALVAAMDAAEAVTELESYTAASRAVFAAALAAARTVSASAASAQETVDGAAQALLAATAGLVRKSNADKTALAAALAEANALLAANYSKESWAAFSAAKDAAQGVLADEAAAQEAVDAAKAALETAAGNLQPRAESALYPRITEYSLQSPAGADGELTFGAATVIDYEDGEAVITEDAYSSTAYIGEIHIPIDRYPPDKAAIKVKHEMSDRYDNQAQDGSYNYRLRFTVPEGRSHYKWASAPDTATATYAAKYADGALYLDMEAEGGTGFSSPSPAYKIIFETTDLISITGDGFLEPDADGALLKCGVTSTTVEYNEEESAFTVTNSSASYPTTNEDVWFTGSKLSVNLAPGARVTGVSGNVAVLSSAGKELSNFSGANLRINAAGGGGFTVENDEGETKTYSVLYTSKQLAGVDARLGFFKTGATAYQTSTTSVPNGAFSQSGASLGTVTTNSTNNQWFTSGTQNTRYVKNAVPGETLSVALTPPATNGIRRVLTGVTVQKFYGNANTSAQTANASRPAIPMLLGTIPREEITVSGNTVSFVMPNCNVKITDISYEDLGDSRFLVSGAVSDAPGYETEHAASYATVRLTKGSELAAVAEAGDSITAEAVIAGSSVKGFDFDHWETDDFTLTETQKAANPLTFTMPASDVLLRAVLKPAGTRVSYSFAPDDAMRDFHFRAYTADNPASFVYMSPSCYGGETRTSYYKPGTLLRPVSGGQDAVKYSFLGYFNGEGEGYSLDESGFITVPYSPEGITVVARYETRVVRPLSVGVDTDSLGMGSVAVGVDGTPAPASTYVIDGQSVVVTALPASRYKFREWKVMGAPRDFALKPSAENATATFVMSREGVTLRAVFERDAEQKSAGNTITYLELLDSGGAPVGEIWRIGRSFKIKLAADTPEEIVAGLASLKLRIVHSAYATVGKAGGYSDADGDEKWADGVASGLAANSPAVFTVTAENGETAEYTVVAEIESSEENNNQENNNNEENSNGQTGNNNAPSFDDLNKDQKVALESLGKVFASCPRSDYTAAEWQRLTEIYEAGRASIANAANYNAIQRALAKAAEQLANVSASNAPARIRVAVTMERFSIDGKYIIEPILITAPRGTIASEMITEAIRDKYPGVAQPWKMTGSVTADFYLSYVWDPTYKGADPSWPGYLGEFDEGSKSGWMYCVNNHFPGVGAAAWKLRDGDVMRWQYTRAGLGADIGADNTAWSIGDPVPTANKDALTWRIAEINTDGKRADYGESYDKAIEVLSRISSTQREVDEAYAALGASADSAGAGGDLGETDAGGKTTVTGDAALTVVDGEIPLNEHGVLVFVNVDTEGAPVSKVAVEITAENMKKVADNSSAVEVRSELGVILIPSAAVKGLAAGAAELVAVRLAKTGENAYTVELSADGKPVAEADGGIKAKIPVTDGNVAVLVHADGTEQIIKKSVVKEGVATVPLSGSATIKVIDNSKAFGDVGLGAWYADAVRFASSHELFNGTGDDSFSPDLNMTRGMLMTVLARIEEQDTEGGARWYSKGVDWSRANDLSDGTNPDAEITREQLATILYRYAAMLELDTAAKGDVSRFADADEVSAYAKDAVAWAIGTGLMQGRGADSIAARGTATRAEVATVLQRFIESAA
jgi:hypothetical protein